MTLKLTVAQERLLLRMGRLIGSSFLAFKDDDRRTTQTMATLVDRNLASWLPDNEVGNGVVAARLTPSGRDLVGKIEDELLKLSIKLDTEDP